MEANGVMFTSSSDLRDLYHHMILHTSMLMQMHRRSDPLSLSLHVASFSVRIFNQLDLKNISLVSYYFMQWVSHRNHRGNICGVDFIWLLNPNKYRKLLKTSWSQAVFGMFKVESIFCI